MCIFKNKECVTEKNALFTFETVITLYKKNFNYKKKIVSTITLFYPFS